MNTEIKQQGSYETMKINVIFDNDTQMEKAYSPNQKNKAGETAQIWTDIFKLYNSKKMDLIGGQLCLLNQGNLLPQSLKHITGSKILKIQQLSGLIKTLESQNPTMDVAMQGVKGLVDTIRHGQIKKELLSLQEKLSNNPRQSSESTPSNSTPYLRGG